MQITTKSGFTCEIDPDVLNNAKLMDALADLQSGNSLAYPTVSRLVLGKDVRAKLYDHLTNEAGRVPIEDVDRELTEIMQALGKPAKN